MSFHTINSLPTITANKTINISNAAFIVSRTLFATRLLRCLS